jgi:hypothetical protein
LNGREVACADGEVSAGYDKVGWTPWFRSDGTAEFLASRDGVVYRGVTVKGAR